MCLAVVALVLNAALGHNREHAYETGAFVFAIESAAQLYHSEHTRWPDSLNELTSEEADLRLIRRHRFEIAEGGNLRVVFEHPFKETIILFEIDLPRE